jgi:D-serine dehydratase
MRPPSTPSRMPTTDPYIVPAQVFSRQAFVWINPYCSPAKSALSQLAFGIEDVAAAVARWRRFAPLLARLFPDVAKAGGVIDSDLLPVSGPIADALLCGRKGRVLVKADHALPVTGCIKARGGVYEVLAQAEALALAAGLLSEVDDFAILADLPARTLFEQHCVVVGSTGNLGFSVGVMARALGFAVEVHMSADAKDWKKDRLRRIGAKVIEHAGDFGIAVAAARASAAARAERYFVDDESSVHLFLGYAAAAFDLKRQIEATGIAVDATRPLVVFLPCGVGGAPGGVAFGLKLVFGDAVRPVFVEPVASPCMLVQLAAGTTRSVSVYDVGLDNKTAADGLAVATASLLVARTVARLVDAIATVEDDDLFAFAERIYRNLGLRLEPSAAAPFAAIPAWIEAVGDIVGEPTFIAWTTGGALLPDAEFEALIARGRMVNATRAMG